ncbi:glycosyltransferase family 39 protein [Halotia branconii]|uniref:Glycosyltransferase family 39 protein n=1 Tax=Halotia branconii CENA392 TaxID=1539056 RepID=A0AAJ6NVC2_9CYAN|nr:glycosyltransferase family 39 protein [Halotia branconii]WGV27188.1 glycosyltransferase family 39 protein [Halotia branconii CENA392]
MTNPRHYLSLAGAIALGAILRFWHLDLKPLWMDEVITAIFSLGKNYHDLPLNVAFPLERVQELFTFQPGVSCDQIAENVANGSTHPPLFFCGMYRWLGWMTPLGSEWVEKLRSLPALFGIGAIMAIYGVNRTAFSPKSGIIAALIMAVSPFAVYLSQEARHYTMPMFLITLSLLGLIQIQRNIFDGQRLRIWVWILWTIINSVSFYVHYFCVLAFVAEIATLFILISYGKAKITNQRQIWLILILSTSAVVISFVPWLLVTWHHFQSSETNWLPSPNFIAPLYQTLISWVLMIIALPVENQPPLITAICGLLMVSFAIWIGRQVLKGLKILWLKNTTHLATFTLLSFTIFIILQFLAIVYLFKKDITAVPRYAFVYYPSFCALLAASINTSKSSKFIVSSIGLISCLFIVNNLAFQKPFQPEKVAHNINLEPAIPVMLVIGYSNNQDIALGLSFALALEKLRSYTSTSIIHSDSLVLLDKKPNLSVLWNKLAQMPVPKISKLNLWIVGPGMRRRDYPKQVALSRQTTCNIDSTHHYRIGIPYQLYRCNNANFR